ncbi:hypothetical protein AFCA_005465 [Aspergillus flavus]|nr:hypothetical protein AFCA_005465 [Aspergillus flavus]
MKNAALEEVEQEREVAFEIEQEREIQRPLSMKAHRYPGLHSSVRNFAITGHLKGNEGYVKAAAVIKSTDLGRKHGIDASTLLCSLYVSTEFTRTVVTKKRTKTIDNFLGQDISHTPMGYVCQGSRLRRDHPFLLARKAVEEIEDADRCLFYTTKHRYSDELGEYYDSDDDDDDDDDVVAEDVDMIEGGEDDVSDVDVDMHEED